MTCAGGNEDELGIAKQVLGLLMEKKREKLLHLGPEIQAVGLANIAERKEKEAKSHDCRKNCTKFSKAMEPDVEVELLRKVKKEV